MSTDGANIAGFRLAGRTWADDLGTWSSAVSADGRPGTALRFDPRLITDRATRDRLVAAVVADRRLAQSGLTGLVPIADLITAQDEVWLLTAEPVSPNVADLLADEPGIPRPDAGSAATILVEIAQTLLAIHAAGLAHGALHPGHRGDRLGRLGSARRTGAGRRAARAASRSRAGRDGLGLARAGPGRQLGLGRSPVGRPARTSGGHGLHPRTHPGSRHPALGA